MLDFHHPQFVTAARGVRLEVEPAERRLEDVVRVGEDRDDDVLHELRLQVVREQGARVPPGDGA